jgi:hypothetical protein
VEEALSDLNRAIELSGGRGKATEQALTQRGIIWRVKGEDEKALEDFKPRMRRLWKISRRLGNLATDLPSNRWFSSTPTLLCVIGC